LAPFPEGTRRARKHLVQEREIPETLTTHETYRKKQKNTSQTKGIVRALVPFTQKIDEINNINFHQLISSLLPTHGIG